jgi:hypothetical protein
MTAGRRQSFGTFTFVDIEIRTRSVSDFVLTLRRARSRMHGLRGNSGKTRLVPPPATARVLRRGVVVQLVRTPACHAGGRGFESRRPRQFPSINPLDQFGTRAPRSRGAEFPVVQRFPGHRLDRRVEFGGGHGLRPARAFRDVIKDPSLHVDPRGLFLAMV